MAGDSKLRQEPMGETGSEIRCQLGSVARFEYPESIDAAFVPTWEGWDDPAVSLVGGGPGTPDSDSTVPGSLKGRTEDQADSSSQDAKSKPQDAAPDMARLIGEERERALETGFEAGFEAGRLKGIEETRESTRDACTKAEQRRIAQVVAALESFAGDREMYLKVVEQEVVKLALAVSARILRREAAVDPLLLSGTVRVALGQIAASTEVKLRVPAAELVMWKEAMAAVPNLAARPSVAAGEGMQLGDCAIETALGTADLGVGAQLMAVERALLEESGGASASADTALDQKKINREKLKQEKTIRESAA